MDTYAAMRTSTSGPQWQCFREQQKKLTALEKELAAAREEGFVPKSLSKHDEARPRKKLLAVIGIITTFGRRKNRDAIRKAWMPTGNCLWVLHFSFTCFKCKVDANGWSKSFLHTPKKCYFSVDVRNFSMERSSKNSHRTSLLLSSTFLVIKF